MKLEYHLFEGATAGPGPMHHDGGTTALAVLPAGKTASSGPSP